MTLLHKNWFLTKPNQKYKTLQLSITFLKFWFFKPIVQGSISKLFSFVKFYGNNNNVEAHLQVFLPKILLFFLQNAFAVEMWHHFQNIQFYLKQNFKGVYSISVYTVTILLFWLAVKFLRKFNCINDILHVEC